MQASIFANQPVTYDPRLAGLRRTPLAGGAWVDYLPTWLGGHEAVYADLVEEVAWTHHRRRMYERVVDVPRLTGAPPAGSGVGDLLQDLSRVLSRHYRRRLDRISLAWYRDGDDSVAMHGDKVGRRAGDCVVAIVAVGGPRRFLLRRAGGPGALTCNLGWGDLLVMGGTCQRTWRHGVPKTARADPRISIQFRERGEGDGPEVGPRSGVSPPAQNSV